MSIQILYCTFSGGSDIEAFVEVMPNGVLKRLSLTDDQEALEAQHATLTLVNQIEMVQLHVDLPEYEDEDFLSDKEDDLAKYNDWWMDRIQEAWHKHKEK